MTPSYTDDPVLVERVAKALHNAALRTRQPKDWDDLIPMLQDEWRAEARDALDQGERTDASYGLTMEELAPSAESSEPCPECPECLGTGAILEGRMTETECSDCKGTGWLSESGEA